MTHQAIIYTDGGYRSKSELGAWGYLIINIANKKAVGRSEALIQTTNNRMELTAVEQALLSFKKPINALVISDSMYTINSCSRWIKGWKAAGWTRKGSPLKNVDILKRLDKLISFHTLEFKWIKGHSGDKGNDYVDAVLNKAMNDFLNNGSGSIHERIEEWN